MSINWEAIGLKLKALRLYERQTQDDVARWAGVTQAMVSRVEAGIIGVSVKCLEKIAGASGGKLVLDIVGKDDSAIAYLVVKPEGTPVLPDFPAPIPALPAADLSCTVSHPMKGTDVKVKEVLQEVIEPAPECGMPEDAMPWEETVLEPAQPKYIYDEVHGVEDFSQERKRGGGKAKPGGKKP